MDNILSVLRVIFICIEVLVIFNLLIIVHEVGHFLAARWRGLVVEQFGIWFGRSLWEKKINGVVYSIGCIPAGGFVKLPQMGPMDVIEGKAETPQEKLPTVGVIDRIIVAFAGPLFSLLLAFAFASVVWLAGKPTHESEATTVIGMVANNSPAEAAGLRPGDRVLSIDGRPVKRFLGQVDSVIWSIIRSEGEKIDFEVERDVNGQKQVLHILSGWKKEQTGRFRRASLRQVGILPKGPTIVGTVQRGTPAEKAGVKAGDVVTKVNGEPIYGIEALTLEIQEHPDRPVRLTVMRDGAEQEFQMQPTVLKNETRPRIGIEWDPGEIMLVYPSPLEQVMQSLATMGNMLDALFSRKSDVKAQHFSGPVGIMNLYYRMFQSPEGWRLALWFSVLFNVNLAVLNMLPIPVLDGGHILMAIIEGIRRRPVSAKIQETVTTAFAMLLIGFMLYVTFYDVQDLPWRRGRQPETVGSPSPAPAK